MKNWDHDGSYLDRFPADYRGTIGDRFCRAIRDGCEDVKMILDWVANNLEGNDSEIWQRVQRTCVVADIDVWEFAEHLLERENLPWDEKVRLKNEARGEAKAQFVKAKMAGDKPTVKQLKYLRLLKCPILPTTKLDAHVLINQFKK